MSHANEGPVAERVPELDFGVWWNKYGKAAGLFFGALIITLKQVLDGDGTITGPEWSILATAVGGGLMAYIIPNLTGGVAKFAKPIVLTYIALTTALPDLLVGGLTQSDWVDLVLLAAMTLGIIPLPAPQRPEEVKLVEVR